MTIHAALMTGKGAGAISTIEVFGDAAESVMREIFKPLGAKSAIFETGRVLIGTICDDSQVIDQVTLGCEGPEDFAIHCHGNPLIVEMIMELLRKHGASLITAEQLLARTLAAQGSSNTIAIEARLAQAKARTVEGTKIIANQIDCGLARTAQNWLDGMEKVHIDQIKAEAARILGDSQIARLIVFGCTAVLTGPPNSGKSTLLNYLAGRQKAIVTDIRGTTRDWVEAQCRIGPLSVRLVDTAGLDSRQPESRPEIDQAARGKTAELLEQADLILLVLDGGAPANELDDDLLDSLCGKQVIPVLNKSDLPAKFDAGRLPEFLPEPVQVSAGNGTGIEVLAQTVGKTCGVEDFDLQQPVCFTSRQEGLLGQLTTAESNQQAAATIRELLRGQIEA